MQVLCRVFLVIVLQRAMFLNVSASSRRTLFIFVNILFSKVTFSLHGLHIISVCVPWELNPCHDLCIASTVLYLLSYENT